MHRSPRYDYARRPYYERPLKWERKVLHRSFRRHEKNVIRRDLDFSPKRPHKCYAN